MGSLSLTTRREASEAVVALDGELDIATVPELRDAALAGLDAADSSGLVLDLAGLTFLDSTGLGCWIDLRNHAEDAGKTLRLREMPPAARRTVTIAGLGQLFDIDDRPGTSGGG